MTRSEHVCASCAMAQHPGQTASHHNIGWRLQTTPRHYNASRLSRTIVGKGEGFFQDGRQQG
eukprot:6543848-Pyramimonas_sp.AAC.1